MTLFKLILQRLTQAKPFYYGWEQRAFERRREQSRWDGQFACRMRQD